MSANVESMFYVNEVPWHGLGTRVEQELTAKEAIKAAGLDWEVKTAPVFCGIDANVPFGTNALKPVLGYNGVVRTSDNSTLGIVGDRYRPIQNAEAFDFFDSVVGSGAAKYHTAGSIGGGKRIWVLAKLPKDIRLINGDQIEKFLVLCSSHDGSLCLKMFFSPIRVVCQNTMNLALRGAKDEGVSIRHTANATRKIEIAQKALGIAAKYYETYEEQANRLLGTQFSDSQMKKVATGLFPVNEEGELSARSRNMADNVIQLFSAGTGIESIRGTAFAAYCAVTEFTDHNRGTRTVEGGNEKENRLQSLWFGSGKSLKTKGLELIQEEILLAA